MKFRALLALVLCASSTSSQIPTASARQEAGGADAAVSEAWLGQVSEDIRREEYAFSPLDAGVFGAPNREQGLRSRVSAQGLEVFPRSVNADGKDAPWRLELRTRSFGRTDGTFELDAPTLAVRDERVELDHGWLVEWLDNREDGIEQGWTIATRPIGSEPLWIGLALGGDLSLRIEEGARSGVLVDSWGEAQLRYTGLRAFDANGLELEARLLSSPDGVGIAVEDAAATYPITVDPLLTGPDWTAESDQGSARLGTSVSTAGDVNGDGYSDVIVAAPNFDDGQTDEGRAYVYHGSASGLASSPAWTAESDQASTAFGASVSTAGDVNGDGYSDVIVGAPVFDHGESDEGRAVVYHGSASGLASSSAWTAESDQASAAFGWSVSTAGDVNGDGYADVIVGALLYDNGQANEGRAFVYHGSASGLAPSATWLAESDQAGAQFGKSVSKAGDVNGDGYSDVIVGAPFHDNGQTDEGRAFVYRGSAFGLTTFSVWTGESNQASAEYGASVSTAGDVNGDGYSDVIVGAYRFDNGQTDEGRASVYLGSASGLAASPAQSEESDQASASFGSSVSTAGDVNGDGYSDVIVGAPLHDNGQTDEGRACVYHGSPSGLATSAAWTRVGNQVNGSLGYSVSTAGDVNGDGYSDVLVGAASYDDGYENEGRAFLYLGSASGLAASHAWSAVGEQDFAAFGQSVSTAGDVNGDGYSDVIVGASGFDNDQINEGRAYVYQGSSTGLASSPVWTSEGDTNGASFGWSVATAGDVNGDGYSDVLVGAHNFAGGLSNEGRVRVFHGSAAGLATSAAWTAESGQAQAYFGTSVSTAGDVNADGYSDVIVGAYGLDDGQTDEGGAFVYHGSASGLVASPAWTAEGDQASAWFGYSVSTAGDVNGDGYSDVIVGAYGLDNAQTDEGRAYVVHGSASGLAPSPAWSVESDQAFALLGYSVSTAGDVNGDGYSDVIVGAFSFDDGLLDQGRAVVHLGSASGLSASPAWTAEGGMASAAFGFSVSTAGDVNGDGYSDVIVGAPFHGAFAGGAAVVYSGNEGNGGLVRVLQQRNLDDTRPLAVQGRNGGIFLLQAAFPRNLAGTSWASPSPHAWLEWEVKPLGASFDGSGIHQGTYQSLVPAGGGFVFDEIASIDDDAGRLGTTRAKSFHWRARVATNNALFPHTAWFSVPGDNITEAKLRKPGLSLSTQ